MYVYLEELWSLYTPLFIYTIIYIYPLCYTFLRPSLEVSLWNSSFFHNCHELLTCALLMNSQWTPLTLCLQHNLLCPYDKNCFMDSAKEYVILRGTLLSLFHNPFTLLKNAQSGSFPPNWISAVSLASQKDSFWRENLSLLCIFLLHIYLEICI